MIAPMPKTLAMANCSEVPDDNISLLLTAKSAYEAPAPSASTIPTVADPWPDPLLAPVKMMTPTTAHAVATHQRAFGVTLNQSQLIAPVSAGAEPSATTVPIVTPLRCTAAKKVSWYPAIPAPAQSQARSRTVARLSEREVPRAASWRRSAPITMRLVPTANEFAPDGPSAAAVPVVPKQIAEKRIDRRARIHQR